MVTSTSTLAQPMTNDQTVNCAYLIKSHKADKTLTMHTNAGALVADMNVYLASLEWLNVYDIASVVFFKTYESI
jgi:hypothetical protein